MVVNVITISSLAEVLGIPKGKDKKIAILLKFGFSLSLQKYISDILGIVESVKQEPYYLLFGVNDDYIMGKIKDISVHFNDCPRGPDPQTVIILLDIANDEFQKLIQEISKLKVLTVPPIREEIFGREWNFIDLWCFNGIIFKQQEKEFQDLKRMGIGLLTILGKKWTK